MGGLKYGGEIQGGFEIWGLNSPPLDLLRKIEIWGLNSGGVHFYTLIQVPPPFIL
jgi:hypothetical protein